MCPGLFFFGVDFFWGSDLIFFLFLAPGFSDRTVPGRGVPVRDFFDPGSPFPGRPDPSFPDPDPRFLVHDPGFPDSWPWTPRNPVQTPGNGRFPVLSRFLGIPGHFAPARNLWAPALKKVPFVRFCSIWIRAAKRKGVPRSTPKGPESAEKGTNPMGVA